MNTRPFHSGKRKAISPVHSRSAPLQKQILWGGVLMLHGWLQQLLPPLLGCRRLFAALQSAPHMFSFVLYTRDMGQSSRGFCTHFADAETQTKGGEVTCPRSHSELVVELRLSAPANVSSENAVVTSKAKRERGGGKGWTEHRFEEQDILATNVCQAPAVCQAPHRTLVI